MSAVSDRKVNRRLLIVAMLVGPVVLGALAATQDRRDARWPGEADFSDGHAEPVRTELIAALDPFVAATVPPRYEEIAASFVDRHETLLARDPGVEVLDELELVFFSLRRVHELAGYYRDAVSQQGDASPLRPRLAWLYQRIGQTTAARHHARLAVEQRPDDPAAWFVHGFVHGQQESTDEETLALVRRAFERVIVLDPDFVGPAEIGADAIRGELRRLRRGSP